MRDRHVVSTDGHKGKSSALKEIFQKVKKKQCFWCKLDGHMAESDPPSGGTSQSNLYHSYAGRTNPSPLCLIVAVFSDGKLQARNRIACPPGHPLSCLHGQTAGFCSWFCSVSYRQPSHDNQNSVTHVPCLAESYAQYSLLLIEPCISLLRGSTLPGLNWKVKPPHLWESH